MRYLHIPLMLSVNVNKGDFEITFTKTLRSLWRHETSVVFVNYWIGFKLSNYCEI